MSALLNPQGIVVYILLSLLAGFLGRRRRIGFWGVFFLSILTTPLATGFFIFVCAPARAPRQPRVKAGA